MLTDYLRIYQVSESVVIDRLSPIDENQHTIDNQFVLSFYELVQINWENIFLSGTNEKMVARTE